MSIDPLAHSSVPRPRTRRDRLTDIGRRPAVPRLAPEPTFHSRFECKYLIDPTQVPILREFLRPHTEPDEFAALRPGFRYPICSLYLDSPDLALYQQTVCGEKDRFKLRVRTYSDDPTTPAFFEVKRKLNNIVHKRRAGLSRRQAHQLLARKVLDTARLDRVSRQDAEHFDSHVSLIEARPVVRIKYMREAYQARYNEPVRVTIDSDLSHAVTLDDNLTHTEGRWTATPLDGVILEIKFTERFPWWVHDLIREFGLFQKAVPKYVLSLDHILLDGRESALALGGVTLPPIRRA